MLFRSISLAAAPYVLAVIQLCKRLMIGVRLTERCPPLLNFPYGRSDTCRRDDEDEEPRELFNFSFFLPLVSPHCDIVRQFTLRVMYQKRSRDPGNVAKTLPVLPRPVFMEYVV